MRSHAVSVSNKIEHDVSDIFGMEMMLQKLPVYVESS